ncbi:MAG: serine hydrolase [Anaerolineae bacterium]|nr:serine hydrolase [Anaerolineae bacterium]
MSKHYWPSQTWQTVDPVSVGVDPELPAMLGREIEARFSSINGLLVVKNGRIVVERYYNGFDETDVHLVFSVTKSFTSALIGIAIDKGYIESVEQHVLDFFPEITISDVLKRQLTIKHLLTMTSGFLWRTGARAFEPMLDRMRRTENWVAFILDLPIRERIVGRFQYNSTSSHLLSAIITRATGRCAREFANEYLFRLIGIDEVPAVAQETFDQADVFRNESGGWPSDPQGHSLGGWGLALKPRDMARFGLLYLNDGKWGNRQVVSTQWIAESITPHTPGYGYQWWLRDVRGTLVYSAVGRGGHHIFCVPEKDLVVAIASQPGGRWRDRWPLVEDLIIPAVM